jgi:phosphoglycolate phosphatase
MEISNTLMHFKGVIFDLDGTLANSLEDIADSLNQVLADKHFPTHSLVDVRAFIGRGIFHLVRVALPESERDEVTLTSCYDRMVELYEANCTLKTKAFEEIDSLLDELKSRKLKLCVFSNKQNELTKKVVQALFPGYFEIVMGLKNESHKKPNPTGALEQSRMLGIPPEKLMFVGDSGIDMQTAQNAGMFGVGVTWGYTSKEELVADGAKITLDHPLDLIEYL